MARSSLCALVAAALVATYAAGAPPRLSTYRVEASLTNAGFAVSQFGVLQQRGHFGRVWGRIVLDPAGSGGSVDLTLDGTSVATGWDVRDDFIRGENMFDVARFPAIHFRSLRLNYDASSLLTSVDGELTLHGATQPVHLDVLGLRCGIAPVNGRDACRARVVGRISRSAFGMGFGYPFIGDDVEFEFAITAVRVRDEGETEAP